MPSLTRPNFLVVLTDDQEIDNTSDPLVFPYFSTRPHGHWVDFENAFCSTPLCYPFRGSYFYGQRSDRNGKTKNDGDPPPWDRKIQWQRWMAFAGYRCGLVGKYLNNYPFGGNEVPTGFEFFRGTGTSSFYNGWDVIDETGATQTAASSGMPSYFTDACDQWAVQFLQSADPRPFFLYLAPFAPHDPFTPATRHLGAVVGGFTDPPEFNRLPSHPPAWHSTLYPGLTTSQENQARGERRLAKRTLLAVDEMLHHVIDKIEQMGKLDNTIIVFSTDNGLSFGRHCIKDDKKVPYRWSIKSSLRIRHPLAIQRTVRDLVTQMDVTASAVQYAGLTEADVVSISGHGLDGVPLDGILMDTATQWRDYVELFCEGGAGSVPTWWGLVGPNGIAETPGMGSYHSFPASGEESYFDWAIDKPELENLAFFANNVDPLAIRRSILAALQIDPHARDSQLRVLGEGGPPDEEPPIEPPPPPPILQPQLAGRRLRLG